MPNGGRKDPYRNFKFRVEIGGIVQAGFSEAVIPDASAEVIEYREGMDGPMTRKLLGRVTYGNVLLKWGSTNSRELYDWWKSIVDGDMVRRNMTIIICDEKGQDAKRWVIRDAWPVKYTASSMKAKGNEVAIEEIELACEEVQLD